MWTGFCVLYLWVLGCAVSSLPSPINVVFSSVNLKNVLHWSPGNGTPADTHFNVQYAIYGDVVKDGKGRRVNWREVQHCTRTVRTWCDLSKETWVLEQGYYAKVRAVGKGTSSKWVLTALRFDPLSDTSFGPPKVSVKIEGNSAIITVGGPMRYQPNNHTPVVSMATFYPQMTYNLSIHNTHRDQKNQFIVDSGQFTYPVMDYDTEYCFSAKTRLPSLSMHCRSSEWQCLTTPKDPVVDQLQRVIVGIVVPSVLIGVLLLIFYFLCTYLKGKGQKSPYILNPPSFHSAPVMFTSAENPNIILITIEPSSAKEPACPPQPQLRCTDPPPLYSPQSAVSPPESVEPWDDVSIDYGVVAVAPKLTVVGQDVGGEDVTELKGKCQNCDTKAEWSVEPGPISGFYAPQAKPCLPVMSTSICTPAQERTETGTLLQAHAWSQSNSGLQEQKQAEREKEGLFINKNPQTGVFDISFNAQSNSEAGKRKVKDKKLDGPVEEESMNEKVPLLSAYASQNITNAAALHTEPSHISAEDYGVLTPARSVEEGDDDYYEEDAVICINWDPETRKLLLPGMKTESSEQSGMHRPMQGEVQSGDMLRLENVYVRQSSEEKEVGTLEEMGRGEETGLEMDEFITKWNLVIPVDQ